MGCAFHQYEIRISWLLAEVKVECMLQRKVYEKLTCNLLGADLRQSFMPIM
jgi:hypothetical protein